MPLSWLSLLSDDVDTVGEAEELEFLDPSVTARFNFLISLSPDEDDEDAKDEEDADNNDENDMSFNGLVWNWQLLLEVSNL